MTIPPAARVGSVASSARVLVRVLTCLVAGVVLSPLVGPAHGASAAPVVAASPRVCGEALPSDARAVLLAASDTATASDLPEVRTRLSVIANTFNALGDARGTFPLVYDVIVGRTQQSIDAGAFADPVWADRLAVRFAGEYLDNLRLHLLGKKPTPHWAEYYRLAADCDHNLARVVAQGIVTHLVDDLPSVLTEIGTSTSHKADYDLYGGSLVAATPGLVELFDTTYGVDISQPLQLWFLGDVFGTETVNKGLFSLVRTFAWINHRKLVVSPWWGTNGIALTWIAGSGAIGLLEHLGAV